MSSRNNSAVVVDILLRLGVIIFILGFLLNVALAIETGAQVWNTFLQIVLLIVFIVIAYIIIMLDRVPSQIFGFSVVMLINLFKMMEMLAVGNINQEIFSYFLMLMISVYFVTKSSRNKKRKMTVF
ncbi:MAG: hypothetical protein K9I94_06590 [Bacteroidales bacterium]|nr:hypothetical protein [Bacteroidales bacterium]